VEEEDTSTMNPEKERQERERAQLADEREARYRQRRKDLTADTTIDPRRRDLYLDRTLWDSSRIAAELDISDHRLSTMRGGRRTAGGVTLPQRPYPHPSGFIPPDEIRGYVFGNPTYAWEAGRVRQFAVRRGLNLLNLDTGRMRKMRARYGRARHGRTTASKVHKAGTPRKGKKTTD
jgi:hypothetical protein